MIHQYKLNGYNIVLDTFSGSVHCVDDVSYDIISLYDKNVEKEDIKKQILEKYPELTKEDVEEAIGEVDTLIQNKQLFTKDIFKGQNLDLKKRDTVVKALCLHVAHTCNLNCEYCFAGQGKYHGEDAIMSYDVGKRALDFLVENSGTRKNLEVDFFGGEPLVNFDVVKQLVAYARSIEKEKKYPVKVTVDIGKVTISCTNQTGDAKEEIYVSTEGKNLEAGFNPKYFLDSLKAIDDEDVFVEFGTSISPCLIKSAENKDYVYMILPIRLKEE